MQYSIIKTHLNKAIEIADNMHILESELTEALRNIDKNRYYCAGGFKSLSGFCRKSLFITKAQTQRIATQARRGEPMENIRNNTQ